MANAPKLLKPTQIPQSQYLAQAIQGLQQQSQAPRSYGELGTRLLADAILQRKMGQSQAAEQDKLDAEKAERFKTIQALFPNDPRAAAAAMLDPSGAAGSFFKGQEPQKLGQGDVLYQGGQAVYQAPQTLSQGQTVYQPGQGGQPGQAQYTAPQFGVTGAGQGYQVGPQGMQDFGALDPTQVQQWSHQVDQQNAHSGAISAGAAAQNAQTNEAAYRARLQQGGFGTPGVGQVLGSTLPPGWVPQ